MSQQDEGVSEEASPPACQQDEGVSAATQQGQSPAEQQQQREETTENGLPPSPVAEPLAADEPEHNADDNTAANSAPVPATDSGHGSTAQQEHENKAAAPLPAASRAGQVPGSDDHSADQVAKAMEHRRRLHTDQRMPLQVACKQLGRAYGGGIGVYFKSLQWLQFLFLLMFICSVPFLVVINVTRFTDAANRARTDFGYKVHSSVNLNSFTFSAILDDHVDKGMLKYMKFDFTYPFLRLHPWMGKAAFLTWISVLDAVATLFFVAIAALFALRIDRFAEHIDKATQEVSDYTVVVRGLPSDATATEVGEHFAKWGRVMDVVLIKDLGVILEYCDRMANLQEDVEVVEHKASMSAKKGAGFSQRRLKVALKLENSMKRINLQAKDKSYPTRAAFVTFDHEHERKNCQLQTPSSWLGSVFMKRALRLNGCHRYWVEPATPPEDYAYENLGNHGWWRRAVVQLSVITILLLCGGAITKLQRTDRLNSITIRWDRTALLYAAARGSSARSLVSGSASGLYNISSIVATLQGKGRRLHADGNGTTAAAANASSTAYNSSYYVDDTSVAATVATCISDLSGSCTASLQTALHANLTMRLGQFIEWSSTKDFLLKEGPAISKARACYDYQVCKDGMPSTCYPCYCLGIHLRNETIRDRLVVKKIQSQCSEFILAFDVKYVVIRVGISASVWAINTMLQLFLKQLVLFEKMDSRTNMEWLYAVYSFLAQLINSTVVLLLVSAGNQKIEGLDGTGGKHLPRWVRKFIMNGSYTDFTPSWYQDVGASLMVLLFINTVLNPLLGYLPVAGKALNRWWVFRRPAGIPQDTLNYAAVGPKFMLHERIAGIMLDITLALIFGSGMPLMYGVVVVGATLRLYADRHILLRCARKPNRYSTCLPMLLSKLLPLGAVVHCAVGLWMHTYFRGRFPGNTGAAFASGLDTLDSASSSASAVKRTSLGLRLTQANGILLFILFILLTVGIIARLILVEWFASLVDSLLRRLLRACCLPTPLPQAADIDAISYSDALCSQPRKLEGLPTYRVEHHPMYESSFRSVHYRIIWDHAYGRERYTRLVPRGRRRNTFDVIEDLILYEEDTSHQSVVLADANAPGVRHRVSRETVEHVGDGEGAAALEPLETAPEGFIKALRAVTCSDYSEGGPAPALPGGMPSGAHLDTEPVPLDTAVGARAGGSKGTPLACWASLPRQSAELEMVEQRCIEDGGGGAVAGAGRPDVTEVVAAEVVAAAVVALPSMDDDDDGTSPYAVWVDRVGAVGQASSHVEAAADSPVAPTAAIAAVAPVGAGDDMTAVSCSGSEGGLSNGRSSDAGVGANGCGTQGEGGTDGRGGAAGPQEGPREAAVVEADGVEDVG